MREILFRGKRKDNVKWVQGFYALFASNKGLKHGIYTGAENGCVIPLEVIPETIGQFTGLTDRNGERIFEGDIVKEWSSSWKSPLKTEVSIYEVVCEYLGSLHLIRKTEYGEASTLLYRKSIVEVIGNIYDNPELLENRNEKL